MTNQQILTKALKKAIDGGFDLEALLKAVGYYLDTKPETMTHWQDYIYRHDFAKALWGDGKINRITKTSEDIFAPAPIGDWKSHLQQMVIADDPIKYLGENL